MLASGSVWNSSGNNHGGPAVSRACNSATVSAVGSRPPGVGVLRVSSQHRRSAAPRRSGSGARRRSPPGRAAPPAGSTDRKPCPPCLRPPVKGRPDAVRERGLSQEERAACQGGGLLLCVWSHAQCNPLPPCPRRTYGNPLHLRHRDGLRKSRQAVRRGRGRSVAQWSAACRSVTFATPARRRTPRWCRPGAGR